MRGFSDSAPPDPIHREPIPKKEKEAERKVLNHDWSKETFYVVVWQDDGDESCLDMECQVREDVGTLNEVAGILFNNEKDAQDECDVQQRMYPWLNYRVEEIQIRRKP